MSTDISRVVPLCLLSAALWMSAGCQNEPAEEVATPESEPAAEAPAEASPGESIVANKPAAEPTTPMTAETESGEPEAAPAEPTTIARVETPDEPMPVVPTVPSTEEPTEESDEVKPLGIGDPAPPIAISNWVTGEPISQLAEGNVYVVEFWATWCGPCRTSMPHLSKLQEDYGDKVQFIGVTREDAGVVQQFLEQDQSEGTTWAEVVTYRLATDQDDETNTAYMRAAGQSGIPTAFIVGRDGAVEWIGHPMSMDQPLAKIVSGDWDREAAIAEFRQQKRMKEVSLNLMLALRAEKYDEALATLDEVEDEIGESAMLTRYRHHVLSQAGRDEEAAALQSKLVEQAWDDAGLLNGVAWRIASSEGEQDLELALRAARRASELTGHQNSSILDTLARVYYEQGDLDSAIEWQRKAVEHGATNASIKATLEKYKEEQAKPTGADESSDEGEAKSDSGETESNATDSDDSGEEASDAADAEAAGAGTAEETEEAAAP
ncbi:Sporulation thiol-disulfide oxidoreductase A precursor [Maioricimonas rarisocia]|uniref:Sporulation thiol-disulfide oxidoreductase A n=1 Tax=Maioricimonas rarisocia TaxID=2528026 RepID=A0A517ZBC9_9PLAN|nr:TlpA disulfide reductase family protein [Maioricimonas rarisocia]QDU39740.1 Sporulation thiol-disulfide oxidoreductase A precursor [Maioricimonas rarisocia]